MTERFIDTNGVTLSVETFGAPHDPAILLIHGAGHSMVAWEEEFVGRLAAAGRYVIRYDSRDAGRSTASPAGAPTHNLRDLVDDAVGLLTALGVQHAQVIGMSQGSAVAQLLTLDHPELVTSLVLASSTPGGPGHDQPDLPGPTAEVLATFSEPGAEPDWSDPESVVAYLVEAERPFAAQSIPFDEESQRAHAERVVARSQNLAAQLTNPFLIDAGEPWRARLGEIKQATLVFHGAEDPLFPVSHGQALAAEIPGARFHAMPQTGHEVFPRALWDEVVPAILGQSSSGS